MDIVDLLVDTKTIDEGKWIPLGADFPGVEVLVRGMTTPDARAMQMKLEREAPREARQRNGQLTDEARDDIIKKVILAKCLRDWRGLTKAGEPFLYSREAAELFLINPAGRVVGKAIVEAIVALEDTRQARSEEAMGN